MIVIGSHSSANKIPKCFIWHIQYGQKRFLWYALKYFREPVYMQLLTLIL